MNRETKKKNRWKHGLAFLLVFVLLFQSVPFQIHAQEDYRTWDQADERWGSVAIGMEGDTVKTSGCLVTSIAKLSIQAGLKTAEEINPGILARWLNENGGFTDSGALYWAKPAEYIDGLSYYKQLLSYDTYDLSEYKEQIVSWIKEGYHLVICVKSGGHWVLVDEAKTLETGEIYIMDSQTGKANADITLDSRYTGFNRIQAYTGGVTPEGIPGDEPEDEPEDEPGDEPEDVPGDEPEDVPAIPFSDVPDEIWYREPVVFVYEHEIMTGKNDTTFAPEEKLSRAEFATILYRMAGEPDISYEDIFPDVPENLWYTDGIMWAYQNGIVTGHGDNTFRPSDKITREQMALMMYRYADYLGCDVGDETSLDEYPDADSVSSYAQQAMNWAVGNGIITGKNEGKMLDPQGQASRAECATIIMRFMQRYE